MSGKSKKRPFFTQEKAELLRRNLGKFDEDIKVDPLGVKELKDASFKDKTFLLHVLLETLCCSLEVDEEKRKKLFKMIYKSIGADKGLGSVIDVDNLARIRKESANRFYEHIKQIHLSISHASPLSNRQLNEIQELSIPVSKIEKYHEAFDEIKVIARGGFGTVCQARHKIDGAIYAVKKIIFEYRKDSDYIKVMREVRNLSSLSNKYVVAYNNAWVQPVDQQDDISSEEMESESDYTDSQYTDDTTYNQPEDSLKASFVPHSYNVCRVSSCSESSSIVFQNDPNDCQSNKNYSTHSLESDESQSPVPILRIKMMLCIQMEYCDYDLRCWLNARNEGGALPFSKSVPDIFKEILCGVAYIHKKEIIHRDLKPQNIFFSEEKGVMKVGDFGLATLISTPSNDEQGSTHHSTDLGTLPYAAPEQRKSHSVYDSKVDMYSLGIILIELLVKTGTKMEFFKVINNFEKGIVPKEIEEEWPEYIPLLQNLLEENHTDRMTAEQVLALPMFQDKNTEVSDLEQKVKDLEEELANKEHELANKNKELANKEHELANKEQELANKEKEFLERERVLTQKFQDMKETLVSKERMLQEVSEEWKLLTEQLNRL